MGLLGLFVLAPLLVFDKPRAFLARNKVALFLVVFGLGLLCFHPHLFGIRAVIGERLFESRLRVGMSLDDALELALEYGAIQGGLQSPPRPPSVPSYYDGLDVTFTDFYTFCMDGGRTYTLYFSADRRLKEWHSEPFSNAC